MPSAMLLCAGYGTRLRPLTDELPKPLVPIGDRSLLAHLAASLAAAGFEHATANVHHLSESFERLLPDLPLALRLVREPVIRGTAGGVAGARAWLGGGPTLVWNADVLVEPPIAALLEGAERSSGMCLAVAPRPAGSGTVGLDELGRVVRLRGERFGVEAAGGDYVGVLALGGTALGALPEQGCLFGDYALPELRRGGHVLSVPCSAPWTDAGNLAGYAAANHDWLRARGLAETGFVGAAAEVEQGVVLRGSVVGAGARITGAGALERCVVWPGAHVAAPLADAVVTGAGRIVPVIRA